METALKDEGIYIKDYGKTNYLKPVLLCLISACYALIFTGGAIWFTGPVSFAALFSTLWIAMVLFSGKKNLVLLLMSIPCGGMFFLARCFLSDGPAGILLIGGGMVVIAALALGTGMNKDHKGFLTALLIAGVWIRLCFIVVVPYYAMCNDVGEFKDRYNVFHSGYIQFINHTGGIIDRDVREFVEWYHPPYYHFAASFVLDLQKLIIPARAENWEGIRALTFLCSILTLYFSYAITGFLKMSRAGRKAAVAILSFLPALIMLAGNLNNDSMGLMFTMAAVCLILDWKETGRYAVLVMAALTMGLSVGTKLSGAVAAPAVLIVIIAGSYQAFREKKVFKGILSPLIYGIVSLPVGLWFFVRNYIRYGVPLTYILEPTSDYMYLGDISFLRKFLPEGYMGVEDCFFHNVLEGAPDQSFPVVLCKTGVFNEAIMRDRIYTALTGFILLWLFAVLMLIFVFAFIYGIVFLVKHDRSIARTALVVLAIFNIAMYLRMNYTLPYACSMNMRYVLFALICSSFYAGDLYGYIASKSPIGKTLMKSLVCLFMLAVVAFYMGTAVYFS